MRPELETKRLRLRGFRSSDHPRFAAFLADETTARFLGGTCDIDTAWRRLAAFAGHWDLRGYGPFAIENKATGEFIGYTGPWFPHGKPEHELMWGLLADAQRQGFATEAARAARDWAYGTLGWRTAVSYITSDNAPSRRVAERLGAAPCGTIDYRGWTLNVWRHPAPEISTETNCQ
jgi:RimJ/RimL family protein N-acetyltransferase